MSTVPKSRPISKETGDVVSSVVDQYWSQHVVCSTIFQTPKQSEEHLEWRFQTYPLFKELSGLYGLHEGEIVLDYGCGPGNDLAGFALYSKAKKIIGVDVSAKALHLAAERCRIHAVGPARIELIQTTDETSTIPLDNDSVDFISCQGVLQHASHPEKVLQEFFRIMKPQARAVVMVYNADSVWLHLYTAYQRLVLQNAFPGLDAYQAFSRNVDGVECPIARGYTCEEWCRLCREIGFTVEYVGGYLSETELASLKDYQELALQDARLPDEHKQFLRSLTYDRYGYPLYRNKHAGIGGVYRLYCWDKAPPSQRGLAQLSALQAELTDLRQQMVQTGSLYTQLRVQWSALEIEYRALQDWKQNVFSIPGVPAAHSMYRTLRKLSRSFGL
jgi:ubiquinone/menaquinone biosynthesis C-methylase UbiE